MNNRQRFSKVSFFRHKPIDVILKGFVIVCVSTVLKVRFTSVMDAIEIAHNRGWIYLYLECDFIMVVKALCDISSIAPCQLQNKCIDCLSLIRGFRFHISYT